MLPMLIIIHALVCVFLTLVVLLQPGNKQSLGGTFGGGSSASVFGGRGATTFLQKLTAGAAILFMVTSLTLSYMSSRTGSAFDAESSVKPPETGEKKDAPAEAPKPAEGAAAPAQPAEAPKPAEAPAQPGK